MFIQFATSDPAQAQRFLDDPRTTPLPDEAKDILVGLVRAGAVRIQDPMMHPDIGVVPERDLTADEQAQIERVSQMIVTERGNNRPEES